MRRLTLILAGLILIWSGYSFYQTLAAVKKVKRLQLASAAVHAERAQSLPQTLSALTFRQIPFIESWRWGLKTILDGEKTFQAITTYSQDFFQNAKKESITELKNQLTTLRRDLPLLDVQVKKSLLLPTSYKTQLQKIELAQLALKNTTQLLADKQTYLILLQNSEELRATGGFPGTYAKLTLDHGQLVKFEVEDIYVPAGQFQGFVPAPPGAKEYLSGGQGLQLPDANWHPDFPTSAQQMMNYFAFAQEQNLAGLIALNLPVVEEILGITGPLELPDYQTTVTAHNLANVARANRSQFFPGSQQKKHFMSVLLKQLIFKFETFRAGQQLALAEVLIEATQNKNLLFYSQDSGWQQLFTELEVAGRLRHNGDLSFYLVESNVGINKANQHLKRSVALNLQPQNGTVTIDFTNHNLPNSQLNETKAAAKHLQYINYQRLIVPTQVKIQKIRVGAEEIEDWDENIITNQQGQEFKQLGFLVTVPEQSTRQVGIELSWPELPSSPSIFIQKQPGLPSTDYLLTYQGQTHNLALKNNHHLNL